MLFAVLTTDVEWYPKEKDDIRLTLKKWLTFLKETASSEHSSNFKNSTQEARAILLAKFLDLL